MLPALCPPPLFMPPRPILTPPPDTLSQPFEHWHTASNHSPRPHSPRTGGRSLCAAAGCVVGGRPRRCRLHPVLSLISLHPARQEATGSHAHPLSLYIAVSPRCTRCDAAAAAPVSTRFATARPLLLQPPPPPLYVPLYPPPHSHTLPVPRRCLPLPAAAAAAAAAPQTLMPAWVSLSECVIDEQLEWGHLTSSLSGVARGKP